MHNNFNESRHRGNRMKKPLLRAGLLSLAATAVLCAQSPAFTTVLENGVDIVGELNGTFYGYTVRLPSEIVSLTPPASPGGAWTEAVLYEFQFIDGNVNGLVMTGGTGGLPEFYGTATASGTSNLGSVFSLTPPASPGGSWTETDLYSFTGGADTSNPFGLALAGNGVFYGVTEGAGSVDGAETVFSLTPPASPGGAWTEAVLYTFNLSSEQGNPLGPVLPGSGPGGSTVLYGVNLGAATVYELTPPANPGGSWTQTVLCNFSDAASANDSPAPSTTGSLAMDAKGTLYGTLAGGGVDGNGSVYSLTPPAAPGAAWTGTILYSLSSAGVGMTPLSGVAIGPGGVLYGTTISDSDGYLGGALFSVTPPKKKGKPWTHAVLQKFEKNTKYTDGLEPGGLIWIGGVLYGSTLQGGASNVGTVFTLAP
jgi:hypothetical protein